MTIHYVGPIIRGVLQGAKIFAKYEGKTYTRLYGRTPGRGVRHGLAIGGAAGTLIDESGPVLDDGVSPQKPYGASSNKSNQARSRPKRSSSRKYNIRNGVCNCHRYSNSRRKF